MSVTCTPSEAAEALNVSIEDLAFWRELGLGPAYIELGPTMVRYTDESLHTWIQGQLESAPQWHCPHCCDEESADRGDSLSEDGTVVEQDPERP